MHRVLILFSVFTSLLLWDTVQAQSPLYPSQSLSMWHLQRAEIRSGILRNKFFTDMQPFTRDEGATYISQNTEQFVYGSDSSNLEYLLTDNRGWHEKKIQSKKPIFNRFYKDPANIFTVDNDNFQLFVNPVILYSQGYEVDYPTEGGIFKNERGAEVRGNIGHKLSFYTYLTDNQARYPTYVNDWLYKYQSVPGDGFWKKFNETGVDHYTARGHITFDALDALKFTFGHGRNFIGQGMRSVILSDFAKDYLHLKINTKIWKFNYQNIFAELTDIQPFDNPGQSPAVAVYARKYYASHYLSLDLLKNLNIGLYEGVVFFDSEGSGRKFDWNYLNPIIFYRAVEHSIGSPDNAMIAATVNYLPTKGLSLYGQYLLDEFKFSEMVTRSKWWGNKYSLQIGLRAIDLFEIKNLDFNLEYNMVRPYTYSHDTSGSNFVHFNQPLAHPLGANLKEVISRFQYNIKNKVFLQATYTYSTQGVDSGGFNFGSNILVPYSPIPFVYGVKAGQGLESNINRIDLEVSYQLRHNLFIDFTTIYRNYNSEKDELDRSDLIFNLGMRWNAIGKNLRF